MNRTEKILDIIETIYPDAKSELNFNNNYELLCAVMLSAQTTDKSVNKVTKVLFSKYSTPLLMSQADILDIESIIKTIGLYKNKSKNLINLSKMLVENFNSEVPHTQSELTSLPGVGKKTANVVLALGFNIPAIAVDTHVSRVSKRLCIAQESDSVLQIEERLMNDLPKNRWIKAHHSFLFFGRYFCLSRNPKCSNCPLKKYCRYESEKHE